MKENELILILDFGGQYNQLVARRVRECNVYCEIYSYKTDLETIKKMNPKGIILTGGPNSCYLEDSPTYQKEVAVALWKKNVHIFMTSLLRFLIIRLQKQRSRQINTITVK